MGDLLELVAGKGRVFDCGELMATVQYEVRVYQEYVDAETLADGRYRVPTLKRTECRIWDASQPLSVGSNLLTLAMEDGRKVNFFVVSDNRYKATGGIYQ